MTKTYLVDEVKYRILIGYCRFFNEFLMANERHVSKEVRDEYLDTMSKIYFSYFKGYLSRLMKLQVKFVFFYLLNFF